MAPGPLRATASPPRSCRTWLAPVAPGEAEVVVLEGAEAEEAADAVVVVACPDGGGEPPDDMTTISAATSRTRKPSTTARRWRTWVRRRRSALRVDRGGGLLTPA